MITLCSRIEIASGLKSVDIAKEVYRLLGFCPLTQKVKPGLLAEATMPEIKGKLVELLVIHGMEMNEAEEVFMLNFVLPKITFTPWSKCKDTLTRLKDAFRSTNINIFSRGPFRMALSDRFSRNLVK